MADFNYYIEKEYLTTQFLLFLELLKKQIVGKTKDLTVIDTTDGKSDKETQLVKAINVLDKDLGDTNTLTVKNSSGVLLKEAVAAINELDTKQGDDSILVYTANDTLVDNLSLAVNTLYELIGQLSQLTVVDTVAGKTEKETKLVNSINVLDKEIGDASLLVTNSKIVTNAINEINSKINIEVVNTPTYDTNKYQLSYDINQDQDIDTVKETIGTISIPKNTKLLSVTLGTSTAADLPETGFAANDLYLDLKWEFLGEEQHTYSKLPMPEDSERIEWTVADNKIKADVVAHSIKRDQLGELEGKELDFIGYDEALEATQPAYYYLVDSAYPNALVIVDSNPTSNPSLVALNDVLSVNTIASKPNDGIAIGKYVAYIPENPDGPQLTTRAINLREAVNELDLKQGDDTLTTTAQDLSAAVNELDAELGDLNDLTTTAKDTLVNAINEHDAEIGDLSDLTTTEKTTLVGAINELDEKQGDETLTTTATTISGAINELDEKQGDETLTTTATTLSGAVNEHDIEIGDISTLTTTAKDNLVNAVNELDEKLGDETLTTTATTISGAINEHDAEIGDISTLTTLEKDTLVESINSALGQSKVIIEEDLTNTDVLKTYIFYQDYTDATDTSTTKKEIGRIELAKDLVVTSGECITADGTETKADGSSFGLVANDSYIKLTIANQVDPVYINTKDLFNDYTSEDTDTISITISTDRKITAEVVDGSIGTTQLDTDVNDILDFVNKNTLTTTAQTVSGAIDELNAKQRVNYKDAVAFSVFDAAYKTTASLDDLYIITDTFLFEGIEYCAGSWMLCVANDGTNRTWKVINNGGKSTIIRAISSGTYIKEENVGGVGKITQVTTSYANDPAGTMYMIAVTAGKEGVFTDHRGIYIKTDDVSPAVTEIFDLGITEDGAITKYTGSTGANIDVAISTTGEVSATAVDGSFGSTQFDTTTNNTLNLVGLGTPLTTTASVLTLAVNEHDAEIGDLATLNVEGQSYSSLVAVANQIANGNMKYKGTITLLSSTTSLASLSPVKKGYVYNVTGASNITVNGLTLNSQDWVMALSDTVSTQEPSFIKIGSASAGGTSVTLTIL